MSLTIVFMGTPDFSVPVLDRIVAAGHRVVAVYSQPPRRAGRGMEETPSPVHLRALALGLPVFTPSSLRTTEAQAEFAGHDADVAVVVAYGLILPKPVLAMPRFGCLNLHGSLLPRWRGAAPIERAIMAGDTETGVEIMQMDEGLDTGAVALSARLAIGVTETAGELRQRLASRGAELMAEALDRLAEGPLAATPQSAEGVTYARKIDKAEARIDWSQPAIAVDGLIRGLSPAPGAWCELPLGKRLERVRVLKSERAAGQGAPGTVLDDRLTIACGNGAVRLTLLQKAGGKPLGTVDFLRGAPVAAGTVLA